MSWLLEPQAADALKFLEEGLPVLATSKHTLILVGQCSVEYRGRAESTLATGDRVILVKADGTLLIHNPNGLKPVNWQPPGCSFAVHTGEGVIVLEAVRRRPPEQVRIAFESFQLLGLTQMQDGSPLDLRGTEFDIRDAIRAKPHLIEEGFTPWAKERMTERGPMDLYGEDKEGRRVIVEVKRIRAGLAEATQLWRYVEKERTKRGVEVRGILVAPAISSRAHLLLLEHGLEFRKVELDMLRANGGLPPRDQRQLWAFEAKPNASP